MKFKLTYNFIIHFRVFRTLLLTIIFMFDNVKIVAHAFIREHKKIQRNTYRKTINDSEFIFWEWNCIYIARKIFLKKIPPSNSI